MRYFEHKYQLYFFLCDSTVTPVWRKSIWPALFDPLVVIASSARGKASVRSAQYESDHKTQARFGRLSLNKKSNERWNHEANDEKHHINTEIWAPSWNQCERDKIPPDLFFSFHNRISPYKPAKDYSFGTVMIFAVREDSNIKDCDSFLSVVKSQCKPIFGGKKIRAWGLESGSGGVFSHSIQDMGVTGLLKIGDWQNKALSQDSLSEDWEVLALNDF